MYPDSARQQHGRAEVPAMTRPGHSSMTIPASGLARRRSSGARSIRRANVPSSTTSPAGSPRTPCRSSTRTQRTPSARSAADTSIGEPAPSASSTLPTAGPPRGPRGRGGTCGRRRGPPRQEAGRRVEHSTVAGPGESAVAAGPGQHHGRRRSAPPRPAPPRHQLGGVRRAPQVAEHPRPGSAGRRPARRRAARRPPTAPRAPAPPARAPRSTAPASPTASTSPAGAR